MSRIDEALRRATPDRALDVREVAAAVETGSTRTYDFTLEQFARERPTSSNVGERVSRESKAFMSADPSLAAVARIVIADAAPEKKTIVRAEPGASEQYRRLAGVLEEARAARGLKRLMITSAVPREGRTSTAVNLALVLSGSYARRVLLIDADLRQPSLHAIFGVRKEPGLCETLRAAWYAIPVIEASPLLSLLPAGHFDQDPLPMLSSDRMCDVLDECATQFDWVLLDTPPLTVLPDAQLLARRAEAVVFVIGVGSAPFSVAEKAMASLGRSSIIGTVLCGMDDRGEACG